MKVLLDNFINNEDLSISRMMPQNQVALESLLHHLTCPHCNERLATHNEAINHPKPTQSLTSPRAEKPKRSEKPLGIHAEAASGENAKCPYCDSLLWVKIHRSWWHRLLSPQKNLCFCRECRQSFWQIG